MGDIFSLGFGPFRWVCTSGRPEDLATTDKEQTCAQHKNLTQKARGIAWFYLVCTGILLVLVPSVGKITRIFSHTRFY
jgi:urocanate hydratase